MYFSKFPLVRYPVKSGSTFRFVLAKNLLRRVILSESLKSVDAAFIQYDIKDGERPEHIAEKLYGDPELHWLVLLTNEIIDPYHDWYKSDVSMETYLQKKYNGFSVYFTGVSDQFLYSNEFFIGSTLSQGSVSSSIVEYNPVYCRFNVSVLGFSEGNAVVRTPSGSNTPIVIHRVDANLTTVHHFEVQKSNLEIGSTNISTVDPLSQQTGKYSYVGGIVGYTADEYPKPQFDEGINYQKTNTVAFWDTYIGRYMGVSGDKINQYSTNNYIYEITKNNTKRTIRLLHPRFKSLAMEELESLLRV